MHSTQTPQKPPRPTGDLAGGIRRQIKAIRGRIAAEDPGQLQILVTLSDQLAEALEHGVRSMRDNGYTDGEIGKALGITRQAALAR